MKTTTVSDVEQHIVNYVKDNPGTSFADSNNYSTTAILNGMVTNSSLPVIIKTYVIGQTGTNRLPS